MSRAVYLKEYRNKNREYLLGYMRDWYKKNKAKNPEKAEAKRKRDYELAKLRFHNRYLNLRTHAKARGVDFFTRQDFIKWLEAQEKICVYCGVSEEVSKAKKDKVLHVDRLDSNKGYVIGNISLACFMCNTIKNNFLTEEETRFIGQNVIKLKWQKLA